MTPFILSTFQDVSPLISQDGNISVANFINHGDSIRDLERSVGGHLGTRRKKRSQRMAKTENYSRQVRKICLAFKTLLVFRMPKNPLTLSCHFPGVSVSQVWWFWSCSPCFSTQLQPQKPPDWSWNPSPHRWSFTWMSQEVSKWVITYL